ncbi:UNVERIFIED_CONTAM: hypothetical protein FKN15_002666 [Acipenser sinensis]
MATFPLFDLAYYIVSILYLNYEPGTVEVSLRSPVNVCSFHVHFSPQGRWRYPFAVLYLIFFCPLNLFYKCVAFLPVKLILVAMKEVVRVRKIAAGIHHAHHAYHNGWVIMVLTGWVKALDVCALIKCFPLDGPGCVCTDKMLPSPQVFMTATHSHSSPFTLVESMLCKVLFSSTAGSAPHDSHAVSHDAPPSPAKSKEELNEGARKRKAKKAE